MSRPDPRDDSGQMAIGLVLVVTVMLLALAVKVFLPIGEATDQKASSRSAADAAALAAAKQIRDDLPGAVADAVADARDQDDLLGVLGLLGGGFGRQEAANYAGRNGADLISYYYSSGSGEIDVEVRHRESAENGEQATSTARADLGLRLGVCRLPNQPEPEPEPTPEPNPADEAPDSETVLTCGDLTLEFTLDGETGRPTLETDLGDLLNDLEPRLIA